MGSDDDSNDDWTEAQDAAWCAEERLRLLDYLDAGASHGGVGERPAWHVGPVVAVWAVGSLKAPGRTGWWAISGDLPCDFCTAEEDDQPRDGLRRIVQGWRDAVAATKPGDETIHGLGLPADLAPLLRSRAEHLLEWVEDDSLWEPLH